MGMHAFLFEQYPASLDLSPEPRANLIEDVCALAGAASGDGRDEAATRPRRGRDEMGDDARPGHAQPLLPASSASARSERWMSSR
jgi:hypothetical protein